MAELRLHHTYARGAAVDVSDNGNHGAITRAYQSPSGSTLQFEPPSSRVQVPPSDSLQRFRSIRTRVRFRLDPDASPDRRYNLMEGYLSFALYVAPDFTLKGTIYDDYETWQGAASDAGAVEPGRWHTAELTYVDSAARVDLRLDGTLVGSTHGVAGPVRPVADLGVAIGIWPDADRYALDGQLDDVKLWATWPEFEDFVDPCCSDTGALDRVVDIMRRDPAVQNREVDPTAILRGLQAISARVRAAIVGEDPERSEQVRRLERQFEDAYRERDLRRILTTCASGYRLMMEAGVSSSAMIDEGREGIELLRRVELGRQLLDPFLEMDAGQSSRPITYRARRRPVPDPPEEVIDILGDAARTLCLPAPTKDEPLPSTEPEENWGQIPHEPWPKRPDYDPEEFERARDDRDDGDHASDRSDAGDGDGHGDGDGRGGTGGDNGGGTGGDGDGRGGNGGGSGDGGGNGGDDDGGNGGCGGGGGVDGGGGDGVDGDGAAREADPNESGSMEGEPMERQSKQRKPKGRSEKERSSDGRQSDGRQSDMRQSTDEQSSGEESAESTAADGDVDAEGDDGSGTETDASTEERP